MFRKYLSTVAVSLMCAIMAGPVLAVTILGTGTSNLVGNDLTDLGNDGNEGAYAPGSSDLGGFDAVFFSNNEPSFGGGESAFNVFDNKVGGGNDKWCCGVSSSSPQIVGAKFNDSANPVLNAGQKIILTAFTLSSANDTAPRDPTVWRIEGSNDTSTGLDGDWTTIYNHLAGGSDWASRLQVNLYSVGDDFLTPEGFTSFRLVVDATGLTSGAFFQVAELEFFGNTVPEPGTLALLGLGLAGLGFAGRRKA